VEPLRYGIGGVGQIGTDPRASCSSRGSAGSGCDAAVRADIAAATSILASSFGDPLSGIILTGSAARGCFHRHSSDIDLLIVLAPGTIAGECVASVAQGLSGLSTPIDATVMTAVQLATDTWPSPRRSFSRLALSLSSAPTWRVTAERRPYDWTQASSRTWKALRKRWLAP
jgi:predicted nucleotidyltransferase